MNQYSTSDRIPKTPKGRKTREKLLSAAENEFGKKGFHEAAISGITQRAGVALGTFYVYFSSKEEIFRALVDHMGHLTRHWIAERIAEVTDRLSAERIGIRAFIEFVREHRDLYRIVSEAQFVAPDAYRAYYENFASGYQDNLEQAAKKNQIRDGDYEVWAWSLIGMSVFLGLRYSIWDESRDADEMAGIVADLIGAGMRIPD